MVLLKHKLISGITLLILDGLWISLFMGPRYTTMIKKIQKSNMVINYSLVFLAYLFMVLGLYTFVLPNINVKSKKVDDSLKFGFLFGIILFGVYDFTAGALLKDWNIPLSILDVLWGGILYFLSSYIIKLF